MKPLPTKVSQYLSKYGMSNWDLQTDNFSDINTAIVVPAICEFENIKTLLKSLSGNDKKFFETTLIIFVINNFQSSSLEVNNDNKKSLEYLKGIVEKRNAEVVKSKLRIGFIDASTEGQELPEKEGGVGFVRKIGMDLALKYFDFSSPVKKILVCLDADCTVNKKYVTAINEKFNSNNYSVALINYEHKLNNDKTSRAIICYEIFLRYYVLGLRFANSHYAFHTIGSTIACDYESYINVEGMNKRKAAEDFYFLEKLAKNFNIQTINSAKVYPSPRQSWRVPFGTGQRVKRFLSHTKNEYLLYDPTSFLILKKWLNVFNDQNNLKGKEYLENAKEINSNLLEFLLKNNFGERWDKIVKNSKTIAQINKQKINWFDGFRTLKLIHHLRDNNFPLKNMFDALDEMLCNFNISLNLKRELGTIPKIEDQKVYLETLRKIKL